MKTIETSQDTAVEVLNTCVACAFRAPKRTRTGDLSARTDRWCARTDDPSARSNQPSARTSRACVRSILPSARPVRPFSRSIARFARTVRLCARSVRPSLGSNFSNGVWRSLSMPPVGRCVPQRRFRLSAAANGGLGQTALPFPSPERMATGAGARQFRRYTTGVDQPLNQPTRRV